MPGVNPSMYSARIDFPRDEIADPAAAARDALQTSGIIVTAGARIAVAAGSRGIHAIDVIVRAAVEWLREHGAQPFIVPAMGSHGGATAAGQATVLAAYGITEDTMGVPVVSSMETVRIAGPETAAPAPERLQVPVFMDRAAWESDGVLLVNRIKPHTDFHGFPESGLMKMSVIGLGKHDQALAVHGLGICGLREQILPAARAVLASGRILGGVAIVENAYDRPLRIDATPADRVEPLERSLLDLASRSLARLPVDDIDVLIVDDLGKDKSGTGLDTNVIGRIRIAGEPDPDAPRIRSIVALRLTPASHGNAIGVGLADVITRDLYDAIDFPATYENGLTSSFAERIKVPYVAETCVDAFRAALRFAALSPDPDEAARVARIVRIPSTLELAEIRVSEPLARELRGRPGVDVSGSAEPLFSAAETVTRERR